jgi:hypothetical protein
MTTTPEPEEPWADPGYRSAPGFPMSDAFYRAIGDYCHAENAKAEAGLDDQPVPYTLTAEAEAVLDGPEPEAEP